jgi:pilus assembly protein Flp/PilA
MNILKRLWKEEEGQDLIEYALLVALIALAAAAVFPALATAIDGVYTAATTCMDNPSAANCKVP